MSAPALALLRRMLGGGLNGVFAQAPGPETHEVEQLGIAAPRELWPPDDVVAAARALAVDSGARLLVTDDAEHGVAGAAFVYTDVWVSMGESAEQWATRVPLLRPYQVTETLMRASGLPDTKFLHCLPAVHDTTTVLGRKLHDEYGLDGAEVTDEVFESARAIVFDQAENRLHTIKAVLVAALSDTRERVTG